MPKEKLMHPTSININQENRVQMIELLNQQLADTFDLYSQIKQAHWNVKGINFIALHEFFDALAAEVLTYVDMIAERVTALGGVAEGTVRMSGKNSRLSDMPVDMTKGKDYLQALVERTSLVANGARDGITHADEHNDDVTADLLTEVARNTDKMLYFLESHLQD